MAWEARGEWGGVGVLDATSDAAQIWVRSSGDLGEQILRGWDRVRSGQPPGGAAEMKDTESAAYLWDDHSTRCSL